MPPIVLHGRLLLARKWHTHPTQSAARPGTGATLPHARSFGCAVKLAAPFAVSLPAIAKHVRVLERAGLLTHHKAGRVRCCRIRVDRLQLADDWLETYRSFWSTRLDALTRHIESGGDR